MSEAKTTQAGHLFEALLKNAASALGQKITPRQTTGPAPLSFAQERLWLLNQLAPGDPVYNVVRAFRLTGPLDVAVLETCLDEIVRRHESLRTNFGTEAGQPVQIVAPTAPTAVVTVDLSDLPPSQQPVALQQRLTNESRWTFDLTQGPLWRVALLRLAENSHVMLLVVHHIVFDGWSINIFLRELATLYRAFAAGDPSPLPDPPLQYADFAVWQREQLHGEALEKQRAYWRQQLSGRLPLLNLPLDRPRPAVQTSSGDRQSLVLPQQLTEAVKRLSEKEGVTLFMTLLAAFKMLLYAYTGRPDIFVATPVANRNRFEVGGLIGCFNNILLMRTDLSGDPDFQTLLGRVRQVALEAYEHQDMPFHLVAELPNLARTPLSQTMFQLRDPMNRPPTLPDLAVEAVDVHNGTANFDLILLMEETGKELTATLGYRTDLFDAETITHMLEQFQTLLESLVANPGRRLLDLPHLGQCEHRHGPTDQPETDTPQPVPDQTRPETESIFLAPQDELQSHLAQIWEQILGSHPIGVRDNFFALGGHSLLAARLLTQIEQTFGKNLSLTTLFQAPTVEQLAEVIRREGWTAPYASLTAIQPGGERPPLFFVPANLGNVFTDLGDLSRAFGPDQPFYAFQDGLHLPSRIDAIATTFLDELRSVQPDGPYFLGGICFGGIVAFEIAQRLTAQQQQVALLAIIEPSAYWTSGLPMIRQLARKLFQQVARRLGRGAQTISDLSSTERGELLRLKLKVLTNTWSVARYPTRPYSGHVDFFLTRETQRYFFDPGYAWHQLGAKGVTLHDIPGTHATITGDNAPIEAAPMQVLAQKLRQRMDENKIL